jgi:rhamnogalacturonyl hydrolase YesR
MSADFGNQYKLAFGFPDEVTVVQRYQKEDGYWQSLQDKFEKKFNENEEA